MIVINPNSNTLIERSLMEQKPKFSRRHLLQLVSASPLAGVISGCGISASSSNGDPFFLRNYVTFKSGGRKIVGQSDVFQRYPSGSPNQPYGEATVLHLGNGRRAYQLMLDSRKTWVYPYIVNYVFGGKDYVEGDEIGESEFETAQRRANVKATAFGTRGEWDFRGHRARFARRYGSGTPFRGFPLVVAFRNEKKPETIFQVETEKPTTLFGRSFSYLKWEIERLPDTTVLSGDIEKYLPWVDGEHPYWDGKGFDTIMVPLNLRQEAELRAAGKPVPEITNRLPYDISYTDFKMSFML